MSRRTQKNVGVVGLGIIGRRVADNLRRRGFHVFVWNRTPRPYPNFVGSPAELAELCDFVQIFVSDDEALLQMVQQMKSALTPQHVIMAHSTVAPHTMRNAAEIVQRRGAHFLDAPFTGSKLPAEKGELVYYVAGDDAAYRRARPILEASSKEIIEIGEIGQATTVKIATNMVTAATVQAAAEALALVHHSGLAPERFAAALRGNASNSATLSLKLPKMIEGDFDPHFSVKHMLKDVQIAARMARSYGLTLGATEAARDSLLEEANSGRGDQDFASLVRFFFPEGLPSEIGDGEDDDDAQQKLNGVEEEAAAQAVREKRPADAAEPSGVLAEPENRAPVRTDDEQDERDGDGASDEEPADELEREREEPVDGREADTATAVTSQTSEDDEPPRSATAEPRDEDANVSSAAEQAEDATAEASDDEPRSEGYRIRSPGDAETSGDADERPRASADASPPGSNADADSDAKPEAESQREEPEADAAEPIASAAPQPHATEAVRHDLAGEPPTVRRANGDLEPAPERDEIAARRSFLSRMFGKGDDY